MIEYGEFDVSLDRGKYIGGSDIPVILGISSFKKRFDLLLEKAGLKERDFHGNRFTEYGHMIEPKIRNHINLVYNTHYEPSRVIEGDLRLHTDGFNGESILEVKSTSDIHSTVEGYKAYLVQLIKYMEMHQVKRGLLAVYDRPADMNADFDGSRLQVFEIAIDDYKPLLAMVNREIDRFRADLARLKENPLLTEQDFLPMTEGIITLSNKIIAFEQQLAAMKEIEQKCKEAKQALYNEMAKRNIDSWTTPNGTKITKVAAVDGGTKTEFDSAAFKKENPELFKRYLREKKTNGRAGYVRVSL